MTEERVQINSPEAILPQGYQRCLKCGVTKEFKEFSKKADRHNGLRPHCRRCRQIAQQQYHKTPAGQAALRRSIQVRANKRSIERSITFFSGIFATLRNTAGQGPGTLLGRSMADRKAVNAAGTSAIMSIITDHCPYCNVRLEYKSKGNTQLDHIKPASKHKDLQASLGNMQWICKVCNIAKSNMEEQEFLEHCCKVADRHRLATTFNLTDDSDNG